ncbi:MAG: methyl-accepting chemotaxis protein, partial [Pseudomonadota bacterium]
AEEVGNLATMSGEAANEISEMLNSSIQSVESIVKRTQSRVQNLSSASTEKIEAGVKTAEDCASQLDHIGLSVEEVDVLVKDISNASNEQSLGLKEITRAMAELDSLTQQNTGQAQDTAKVASNLKNQSVKIHKLVTELSLMTGVGLAEEAHDEESEEHLHPIEASSELPKRDMGDNVIMMPELENRPTEEPVEDSVESKNVDPVAKKASGGDSFPDWDDPGFEEV